MALPIVLGRGKKMVNDENVIYIGDIVSSANHAGNKARNDMETIFSKLFGKPYLILTSTNLKSVSYSLWYLIRNVKKLYLLLKSKEKIVLLQYPFQVHPFVSIFLLLVMKMNNVILFVHDIDEWRHKERKRTICAQGFFYNAKVIVVHNQKMLERVKGWDTQAKLINLEIFDYLRDSGEHQIREFSHTVSFAGNLTKSMFLHTDLEPLFKKLYLYGPGKDCIKLGDNVVYKGSFTPDEIPAKLEGSFGLIWDGESADTCSGNFGEYTKYNNPHKLSLYISSCLPVIVWSHAASADFVKKYNIGFCVDSLHEIEGKLAAMTDEDYKLYLHNLSDLQQKIISGYFTKRAIVTALENCKY